MSSDSATVVVDEKAKPRVFKDATKLTAWLKGLLIAEMAASVISIFCLLEQKDIFLWAQAEGLTVDDAYIEMGMPMIIFMMIYGLLILGAIVITGVWLYRTAWNAHAISQGAGMKYSPRAAVLWYFVPFANLVVPYRAMKESWTASFAKAGWLLPTWWFLWLAYNLTSNYVSRASFKASTLQDEIDVIAPSLTSDILNLPLCAIFLLIATRLHRRQKEQHLDTNWARINPATDSSSTP